MRTTERILQTLGTPRLWAAFCLLCSAASAQNVITTYAGTDFVFDGNGKPATQGQLGRISSVGVDAAGNVYTGDVENHLVYRIAPDGVLSVVAGNGINGYTGDGGPATRASFVAPLYVAIGSQGDLYIADTVNQVVRRIDSSGTVSTVAGHTNATGYGGDGGPALSASFFTISSLAVAPDGTIYVADTGKVRRIKDGTISLYAGGGTASGDGPAVGASLRAAGLAVDSTGNLFISDAAAKTIRMVTPDGKINTVAGGGTSTQDGAAALQTQFRAPAGIALDSQGTIYVADASSAAVRAIGADRTVRTVAGTTVAGFNGDGGRAASAQIGVSPGLAVDSSGALYIADRDNLRVRRVAKSGVIQTIAGVGQSRYSGDGGPAVSATFGTIASAALDSSGNLYVSDSTNHRVRRVGTDGLINTVAGNGAAGDTGDEGPGTSATLLSPAGLATTPDGDLFIADRSAGAQRIRRLGPDGLIHAAAGKPGGGDPASFSYPIDARQVQIGDPVAITTSPAGNLFYLDPAYKAFMFEVLSNNSLAGFPCIMADLCPEVTSLNVLVSASYAQSVNTQFAFGKDGLAYFAVPTQGVYRLEKSGAWTLLAGTGKFVPPYDTADGITIDNDGNVVFTNSFYVYKIGPTGVTILAGTGPFVTAQGDGGLATQAGMFPISPVFDSQGNLYVADLVSHRVRVILAKPPSIQVGSSSLSITGLAGGAPAAKQTLSVTASVPGIAFTATTTAGPGNWLSVSSDSGATPRLLDVTADPGSLAPGVYHGVVTIVAQYGVPQTTTVNVTFTVLPGLGPVLSVDTKQFSFSYPKTGTGQSQKLTIANSGAGRLSFAITTNVSTPSGAKWLAIGPSAGPAVPAITIAGIATPASPAVFTVVANPAGLSPGLYTGTVTVISPGGTSRIPVNMTISSLDQVLQLSQRGLSFTAVAKGGVVPPQTFAVKNIGTGVVRWTTSTSTLSGGQQWLQVSPASGSSDAAQAPPAVTVTVNGAGLAEGIYYGVVQVNSPAAANSPQVVTVFLEVLREGSPTAPVVDQGSLQFSAAAGGSSPSSQSLSVYNITSNARSFRSVVSADSGLSVVTLPTDATLDPQHPTPVVVQPFTGSLAPGVYSATLTLQFSDGRVLRVNLQVIVSKTGVGSAADVTAVLRGKSVKPADLAPCTPSKLLPALISLADSAELPTGLPVKLGVYLKDDCGAPVQTGSVRASFSNNDNPASLASLSGGLWEGQWLTHNGALSQATVKLHAENGGLTGDQQVTANLLALEQPPAFDDSGIAAVFGGAAYAPIAPGSVIAIYGAQLAADSASTSGSPLPPSWLGTQAFISGGNNVLLPLPLYYVSPGQVNAVVPYEVQTDTPLQLLVQRGSTVSQPVQVNVAAAGPVLYGGPGAVTDYPSKGGAFYAVTASAPAHAGDTLVFYCLGLGAVIPSVTGGGVPGALANTVNTAQVQIGSQTTPAAFAGLTSQFPGLYQINVVVPANTSTGVTVPVTVTIGGQTSPPITMAIQ